MPYKRTLVMEEIAREIHGLGIALLRTGKVREAAFQFRKALLVSPGLFDSAVAIGYCMHQLGEYTVALEAYEQALQIDPDRAELFNNLGNTLLELRRYEEAVKSYSRALELAPALLDASVALATCYQALGQFPSAMAACNEVIAVAPDNAEAHWNRALLLLLHGEYREGWQEYEWRWLKRGFTSPLRKFPQSLWRGEPVADKTLLIHAEQGYGDTLQFSRYVPLLAARCAQVIFECHPPLVPLMNGLGDNVSLVCMGTPLPLFDLHLPLLSLPLLFETTVATIPDNVPYLMCHADKQAFWQSQTINTPRLKVGLCWAGKSYPDPGRSCPMELLALLSDLEGIAWYSLQVGWEGALPFPMSDLTGHIYDFGDTAGLMAQLDLVISVDTAVAHLAGSLAKQTWLMLPFAPDWRWMLDRDDSPWYPTMQLFRQIEPGSWLEVVQRVATAISLLQVPNNAFTCRHKEIE